MIIGKSTDVKPTKVPKPTTTLVGAKFYETDTLRTYIYDGSNWKLYEESKEFDVSIYPVRALVTTDGVQYDTVKTNQSSTVYTDLFDIDTDTYFPHIVGKLAWVYVNISFEIKGGTNLPTASFKLDADNKGLDTWTIMSAVEPYKTTVGYVAKRLEGYLKITDDLVDKVPLSIRLQFKSSGATAIDLASVKLKNDTVIRLVGTHKGPE